ncbi:sigma-70 family RNA polymerase sigma factor [Vibrio celticus]|nr:sigma-70 family RNA polymerase sigma factor [Vibrio celticus]
MQNKYKAKFYGEEQSMARYISDIVEHDLLTAEEEFFLFEKYKTGCRSARDRLIICNLKLVVKTARSYSQRLCVSLNLLDLINEGNIGLMKAIDKFDHTSGDRLSTYATWWIKESIESSLFNVSRTVRIPVYKLRLAYRISRIMRNKHEKKFISLCTVQSIADELKVSISDIHEAIYIVGIGFDSTANAEPQPRSIKEMHSESIVCPLDSLCKTELESDVRKLIENLPERERIAVSTRFSVTSSSDSMVNFKDVGDELGVCFERARQINKLGIERLRLRLRERGWDLLTTED